MTLKLNPLFRDEDKKRLEDAFTAYKTDVVNEDFKIEKFNQRLLDSGANQLDINEAFGVAQSTPAVGDLSKKTLYGNNLVDMNPMELKQAKETIERSSEIARRENAQGLLPEISTRENNTIKSMLEVKQIRGIALSKEEKDLYKESSERFIQEFSEVLSGGPVKKKVAGKVVKEVVDPLKKKVGKEIVDPLVDKAKAEIDNKFDFLTKLKNKLFSKEEKMIDLKKNNPKYIGSLNTAGLDDETISQIQKMKKEFDDEMVNDVVTMDEMTRLSRDPVTDVDINEKILDLPKGGFGGLSLRTKTDWIKFVKDADNTLLDSLEGTQKMMRLSAEQGRGVKALDIRNQQIVEALENKISKEQNPEVKKLGQAALRKLKKQENIGTGWQKFVEMTSAMKLTSDDTFNKNIMGMVGVRPIIAIEKGIAGLINSTEIGAKKALSKLVPKRLAPEFKGKLNSAQKDRFVMEAAADIIGAARGIDDGIVAFYKGMKDESLLQESFERFGIAEKGIAIKGLKGKAIRLPFRLLGATDNAFKEISASAGENSRAYRLARQNKNRTNPILKEINDNVNKLKATRGNKSFKAGKDEKEVLSKLAKENYDEVLESAFQDDLGPISSFVQQGLNLDKNAAKIVQPFWKTLVNLSKFSFRRSQLGFLSPKNMKDVFSKDPGKRAEGMSRVIFGQLTGAYLVSKADEGRITGRGPDNKAERDVLMETGWKPYSLVFEDENGNKEYKSYSGIEPFASIFALSAGLSEAKNTDDKTIEEKAGLIGNTIIENLTNSPFITGMLDVSEAFTDPKGSGKRFFNNVVAGLAVPTGVKRAADIRDERKVQVNSNQILNGGLKETLMSRIPGLKEQLPQKFGPLGTPLEQETSFMHPIKVSTQKLDALDNELSRLEVFPALTPKTIDGVRLTSKEVSVLDQAIGGLRKQMLVETMSRPYYTKLSDNDKRKELKDSINTFETQALKMQVRVNSQLRDIGMKELKPETKTRLIPHLEEHISTDDWKRLTRAEKREAVNTFLTPDERQDIGLEPIGKSIFEILDK